MNYQQALELLKNRFANPQLIISNHMESLYKLKEVDTDHDIQRFRNLYDKIESNIRGFMGLGINKEQYGPMLIPLIMGKIPSEFRLMISRKFEKGTWDINGLLETFRTELEPGNIVKLSVLNLTKGIRDMGAITIDKEQGPYLQQH